jgi:hypothetical protein
LTDVEEEQEEDYDEDEAVETLTLADSAPEFKQTEQEEE